MSHRMTHPLRLSLLLPLLLSLPCLAATPAPLKNPPPKPDQLAPGATLVFDLPELGTSAHSNGKSPIRAQVRLPLNWDKEHAFPVWVHLGGEEGYDEKGVNYFSAMFGQKNFILMTVDFPKDGHKHGLPTAVQAIKHFSVLTKARLDTANLCLSGVTGGARALEANAQAGGRELAAFRFRVVMGGGDLDGLAQNPGPPAHWLVVGKKPLKVLDALQKARHECTTLETAKAALSNSYRNEIRTWFEARFGPARAAAAMAAAAEKAKDPKEKVRLLAPVKKEFLDFPDIQKAKELLAAAEAQLKPAEKKP